MSDRTVAQSERQASPTAKLPRSRPPARKPVAVVQRRANVRRIDPWTVLKLSAVFYSAVLGLVMAVLTAFWALLHRLGIYDSTMGFLSDLNFEVQIDAGSIARALFLVGLLGVVLFSALNVFFCFLYNLIADLSGGLRVTLEIEE